jgi:protoporphyrinogen oxidase
MTPTLKDVVIIGAGPAGLTSAYLLTKAGKSVTVLEADSRYVGGISKTINYKDYRFDIGGHRFFSKSKEVEDLWTELLPNDMLDRPRSSRIFYRGKFFAYPLRAFEALFKLGVFESILCVLSYAKARVFPVKNPRNFEDWVSNQFGKRLFGIFFRTYTEKVWGMSCKEISADWAAQRIKGLSLSVAIINALKPKRKGPKKSPDSKGAVVKTLIDSFRYPRLGPGMMWEAAAEKTIAQGGEVKMGCRVTGLTLAEGVWTIKYNDAQGAEQTIQSKNVISSAPIRELIHGLKPEMKSKSHAEKLRYRDFITVAIILKDRELFIDNWIYIHDPSVKVGRVQNFKSWSPQLVPNAATNCYGLEYFCFEGDGLWASADKDLIALAEKELEQLGLAKKEDMIEGSVVRQQKAYPVYDDEYATHVQAIRTELERDYPGLHLVGRNGMHKYNNQDHAMMTAMLTVQNILAGKLVYNVWDVNEDAEYHESGNAGSSGLRQVPRKI